MVVAGGDDGVLVVVARKTVPTVAVCQRPDRENREDCPPTHFFIFIFVLYIFFNFLDFLPCFMLTWVFIISFFVYNFWDSRSNPLLGNFITLEA